MSATSRPAPARQRAYEANIRRFYVYKFLLNFQFWLPIWVLYLQRERGFSLTQVTALDAPFWLVVVLCEVPTGAVADRWGRKFAMLLGSVSFGLAVFLFGIATTYWWILGSYLVWGVSMTLTSGADSAFAYDSLAALGREGEFRRVFGRARACEIAAGLVGGLAGAPLAAATSLSFPILVSAGVALAAALVVLTFREPEHRERGPRPPYVQILGEALRTLRRSPSLRWLLMFNAVLAGSGAAEFIFAQPFLAQHQVPVSQFGLLTMPLRLCAIAGSLLAYRWAARLGERRVFSLLLAGFCAGMVVISGVPSVYAFAAFPLLSACNATLGPLVNDYLNRRTAQHLRATLVSVASMGQSVSVAAFELSMGYTADHHSLQGAFTLALTGVAVLGGGTLLAWTLATRTESRAQAARPATVGAE